MFTNADRKLITKGIKILRREWPKHDNGQCIGEKSDFGCWDCQAQYIIHQLDSLVGFFMTTREDMNKYDKIAKKITKKNPK